MAGIKISELSRWSLNEIEGIDANDILVPVSINANTGALRASTLVAMLEQHAPEYYMGEINANIAALNGNITSLNEAIAELRQKNIELEEEIERLKNEQAEIDATQTTAISEQGASIADINVVNTLQDTAINQLRSLHDWENYNDEDNTENPVTPAEPPVAPVEP